MPRTGLPVTRRYAYTEARRFAFFHIKPLAYRIVDVLKRFNSRLALRMASSQRRATDSDAFLAFYQNNVVVHLHIPIADMSLLLGTSGDFYDRPCPLPLLRVGYPRLLLVFMGVRFQEIA